MQFEVALHVACPTGGCSAAAVSLVHRRKELFIDVDNNLAWQECIPHIAICAHERTSVSSSSRLVLRDVPLAAEGGSCVGMSCRGNLRCVGWPEAVSCPLLQYPAKWCPTKMLTKHYKDIRLHIYQHYQYYTWSQNPGKRFGLLTKENFPNRIPKAIGSFDT